MCNEPPIVSPKDFEGLSEERRDDGNLVADAEAKEGEVGIKRSRTRQQETKRLKQKAKRERMISHPAQEARPSSEPAAIAVADQLSCADVQPRPANSKATQPTRKTAKMRSIERAAGHSDFPSGLVLGRLYEGKMDDDSGADSETQVVVEKSRRAIKRDRKKHRNEDNACCLNRGLGSLSSKV